MAEMAAHTTMGIIIASSRPGSVLSDDLAHDGGDNRGQSLGPWMRADTITQGWLLMEIWGFYGWYTPKVVNDGVPVDYFLFTSFSPTAVYLLDMLMPGSFTLHPSSFDGSVFFSLVVFIKIVATVRARKGKC